MDILTRPYLALLLLLGFGHCGNGRYCVMYYTIYFSIYNNTVFSLCMIHTLIGKHVLLLIENFVHSLQHQNINTNTRTIIFHWK